MGGENGKLGEVEDDVEVLNELLRGEQSAEASYSSSMAQLGDSPLVPQLEALRDSHRLRREVLASRITEQGGVPDVVTSVLVWQDALESAEDAPGHRILTNLEDGERRTLNLYETLTPKLSSEMGSFVRSVTISEQHRTLAVISELRHSERY